MKFDTIIIGGGLSGLTAGIALQKAGKNVAVLAAGQSTLHFHSGSFDLLGYDAEGKEVISPIDAIRNLDASHPYSKVSDVATLAEEAAALLKEAGINVNGSAEKNHYRITPMGLPKPAWLTIDDYFTSESSTSLPYNKVLLVNIAGFLDFPVEFISDELEKLGANVSVKVLQIPALQERRMSPSEMRSANIAKVLTDENTINVIAEKINTSLGDAEVVLIPAILGLNDEKTVSLLRSKLAKPLHVIATLPPSVPGVRVQTLLRKYFVSLGGTYMLGSTVTSGTIVDNRVTGVAASTLHEETLVADNYILASGSFQSQGIVANYKKVYEPVFDLDCDYVSERPEWTKHNVFEAQPYMTFGVKTDSQLHAIKGGVSVSNLYAVGSVLSGHNAIKQADGTGVSLITALAVAKSILK